MRLQLHDKHRKKFIMFRKPILLFGLICILSIANRCEAIVGGIQASSPPIDDPVVFVRYVGRSARVEGTRSRQTGLYSFRGIRYAEAPTGEHRFQRPRFQRLSGDIDAIHNGPPCPQPEPNNPHRVIGNEDCLLLNIYTPQMPDETTGLPVVVWIHGGGYRYRSAAQYGAEPLTQNGVIFIPIQYRLGSFGIIGDGSRDFSGNLALLDMATAVRWVKDYISWFGGDPNQIKVIGQGSGATAAMVLSSATMARSSISGVVAMSGSPLQPNAYDSEPTTSLDEIVSKHNCSAGNETEIVKCMRGRSAEDIIKTDSELQVSRLSGQNVVKSLSGHVGVAPSVEQKDDGRGLLGMLTDKPEIFIKKGNVFSIPLLIGVTKDETANGIDIKEIESVFSTATDFLQSTSKIVGLDNFLNLNKSVDLLDSLGGVLNLQRYLEVPKSWNVTQIFSKLVEATTDAVFNLPAVVTAQLWSDSSKAYFYSFEHRSDNTKGSDFLTGLPLVSKVSSEKQKETVAHGDELGILFDTHDIFGNPVERASLKSKRDLNARQTFATFIAKFAHMNASNLRDDSLFKPFSSKGTPYIRIGEQITSANDFRFCQLSLWGAKLEALKSVSCKFLGDGLGNLNRVVSGFTGLLSGVQRPASTSSKLLGVF
ncbi:carboxylesterase 1E-like [Toxorhynchites rutilus septentrionalis]|uniref:carboxylesterase 1E-like n=1 Tax=Toxorhynchites rutilus septentrionalis TaxID=329112 RepID=UPI00247A8CE4|nr:carboxylesterase 1E-like [Toxorhynchites rutilus septentrionalis]